MPMPDAYRVTRLTIMQALAQMGASADAAAIDAALAAVDQNAVFDQERARYTIEVWDRQSPINGVPAERILSRPDVGEGAIYLVKQDGRVLFFQPHPPFEGGMRPMSADEAPAIGAQHADDIAGQVAAAKVVNQVLLAL